LRDVLKASNISAEIFMAQICASSRYRLEEVKLLAS